MKKVHLIMSVVTALVVYRLVVDEPCSVVPMTSGSNLSAVSQTDEEERTTNVFVLPEDNVEQETTTPSIGFTLQRGELPGLHDLFTPFFDKTGRLFVDKKEVIVERPKTLEELYPGYIKMRVLVTAYCPCARCCGRCDGRTATNSNAWKPGIAVDKHLIKMDSFIHVPGYERAEIVTADDTGRCVKGRHVDVRMTYHWQARQWGKQYITILVWPAR